MHFHFFGIVCKFIEVQQLRKKIPEENNCNKRKVRQVMGEFQHEPNGQCEQLIICGEELKENLDLDLECDLEKRNDHLKREHLS